MRTAHQISLRISFMVIPPQPNVCNCGRKASSESCHVQNGCRVGRWQGRRTAGGILDRTTRCRRALLFSLLACPSFGAGLQARDFTFGILAQRSPTLTANYWNPILAYASRRSGVNLVLRSTRSGNEASAAVAHGEYDFAYTNHIFKPANRAAGYRVILRANGEAVRAQIVTLASSAARTLADLQKKPVGFPSKAALLGYAVPMDHLLRNGIEVQPIFGANQEGIMAQLKAGRVAAICVNSQLMREYARRESLSLRILWESEPYHNLPVVVHPRVPADVAEAVRRALADMMEDTEGEKILAQSAALVHQSPPFGFVRASNADYQGQVDFFRTTLVRDME